MIRPVAPKEPIVRGAILAELLVAGRYGKEFADAELRRAGVDPDSYGFLSFVGTLQPVTRTRLGQAAATTMARYTWDDTHTQVSGTYVGEIIGVLHNRATKVLIGNVGSTMSGLFFLSGHIPGNA